MSELRHKSLVGRWLDRLALRWLSGGKRGAWAEAGPGLLMVRTRSLDNEVLR